jgi:uncharacterized membrane protein YhhN
MNIALILCLTFILLDWISIAKDSQRLQYLAKPAALIFLVIWFASRLYYPPTVPALLFLIGLIFSLIGDVFLMLPGNRFLFGLGAFLFAQIAYCAALNWTGVIITPASLALASALALLGTFVLGRLRTGMLANEKHFPIAPLIGYSLILSLMAWSATTTLLRPTWPIEASVSLALGGLLFYLSDNLLAWNRFVRDLPAGHLLVHITYHTAQLALSFGMLIVFAS